MKPNMHPDLLAHLERLVDELMKTKPNQIQVQTYMKMAGLSYTTDPLEQLGSVLSYLQGRNNSKSKVREDEPNI
jgi:hypothetical protein